MPGRMLCRMALAGHFFSQARCGSFANKLRADWQWVIGIGGLGHIAIKLLRAMGADRVVNSRDPEALKVLAGQFDLSINTVAVDLDWQPYFEALS